MAADRGSDNRDPEVCTMTTFAYPPDETAPEGFAHWPVNIEGVKTFRKLTVTSNNRPGIQFHFLGNGATVEWSFLTEADRDAAYTQLKTDWGDEIG
jgi:hypothetical protein